MYIMALIREECLFCYILDPTHCFLCIAEHMFVPWVQLFDLIRRIDRNPLKQFHLKLNDI